MSRIKNTKNNKELKIVKLNSRYILRPDCAIERTYKNCFRVFINKGEEILEVDKETGDLLEQILPMLNGCYSLKEIINLVKESYNNIGIAKSKATAIIANLFKWGLVSEVSDLRDSSKLIQLSYFSSFTSFPSSLQRKLENTVIGIVGYDIITPLLIHSLYHAGVSNFRLIGSHTIKPEECIFYHSKKVANKDWFEALSEEMSYLKRKINLKYIDKPFQYPEQLDEVEVILFLVTHSNRDILSKFNKLCLKKNIRILLGSYDQSRLIIGPYVIPFYSSCLSCIESRYQEIPDSNLETFSCGNLYLNKLYHNTHSDLIPFIMSYASLLAGYVCLHVLELSNLLINCQIEIDYKNGTVHKNYILKSPRCPACGKLVEIKNE